MSTTPYMGLTLPDVSITAAPDWATYLNYAFTAVDLHDHTNAMGVTIPIAGLNINAALPMGGFDITSPRSVRLTNHAAALAGATDLGCLFEAGGELYYRDASGNSIQLTASGALNASSVEELAETTERPRRVLRIPRWPRPSRSRRPRRFRRSSTAGRLSYEESRPLGLG